MSSHRSQIWRCVDSERPVWFQFARLLDHIILGIDEAHLLVPRGKEFRKAYRQISLLRSRDYTAPNLAFTFKNPIHSLGGYSFSDISWVFKRGAKVISTA